MSQRLENKVAIVTGAAQGIGEAIVRLFAEHGAMVVATNKFKSPNDDRLTRILADFEKDKHLAVVVDVTDKNEVNHAVQATLDKYGKVDILINNAGINVFNNPILLSQEDWKRCFSVDLDGAWNCSQAVLPHMISKKYGHIVNIASVHGHKIIPGCFPYPVAKHGLIGLTKALGIEYAALGIRVNSISPGLILTEIAEEVFKSASDPQKEKQRQIDILPCKRIGTPLEVAYTALFLASDEARYINATDILIDGGRSQLYHE